MNEIIIFDAESQQVEVRLEGETLWITQAQLAALFEVQKEGRRSVIRQVEHFRRQNKPRLSHGKILRHSRAGGNPVDGNMPREAGQHGYFVRYAECFIAGFPPARE